MMSYGGISHVTPPTSSKFFSDFGMDNGFLTEPTALSLRFRKLTKQERSSQMQNQFRLHNSLGTRTNLAIQKLKLLCRSSRTSRDNTLCNSVRDCQSSNVMQQVMSSQHILIEDFFAI